MLARLLGRIEGFAGGSIFLALTLLALVSVTSGCVGLTSGTAKALTPTTPTTPAAPTSSALTISTTLAAPGLTGQPYSFTLTAKGGTPSYTWSIASGTLPAGLALMASSGQITGTPTAAAQSSFTVQVKDSASTPATATQALTITVTVGVAVDQYGGRSDITCPTASGWTTAKVNTRWWLCTPAGHGFFLQGVGAWVYPGSTNWTGAPTVLNAKYGGSVDAAALATQNEFLSWNFNAVGEKTYQLLEPTGPCNGCRKLPEIQTVDASLWSLANNNGYAQRPTKDMMWGMNSRYIGWRAAVGDFFDPQWAVYLAGAFANDTGISTYKASPYFVGMLVDDSDWFWGIGAGPDFHTFPTGHNNSDPGYMVVITSPVQTFNASNPYNGAAELYADPNVYSKIAMASPPPSCSMTTPCSLRDYLYKKYNGSISALNTAWGSNYTTFDSAGTAQSQNICTSTTWTGSNTTCSDTIAKVNASPETVQVIVDGTLQAGDCPYFQNSTCGSPTNGTGNLRSASAGTITGTINYTTGAITIVFKSAPAAGSHTITVKYVQNGWMYGTGLMDEDGRNSSWVGTNPICILPRSGTGPGSQSYSCDGTDNPLPNANANFATDIDGFTSQFAAQYFGTMRTQLKATAPNMLYLGPDILGGWGAPASRQILQVASLYLDAMYTQWFGNEPDQTTANQMYSYMTQYFGDKPILNFMTLSANPDSAMSAYPSSGAVALSTQPLRGQQWSMIVTGMLNTPSFNNTYQWVGIAWWGSHDFTGFEKTDWGLKSPLDNAYDGIEAVTGTVPCSVPLQSLTCGGESKSYGNAITGVKSANQLWLTIP